MSTPFFCLGFSKKRKRDTKHKTPHSATPSIDGDGTRRAVFRTRFHERERGEGSRARFREEEEEETPLPAPFSSFLLVKVVLLNTKKGAWDRFICPSSLVVHRAKPRALECLRRWRSRWRDRSRKESFARGRRRRRRRRLFLFVRARPFPGTTTVKKAPPPKTPTRVLKFGSVR